MASISQPDDNTMSEFPLSFALDQTYAEVVGGREDCGDPGVCGSLISGDEGAIGSVVWMIALTVGEVFRARARALSSTRSSAPKSGMKRGSNCFECRSIPVVPRRRIV